MSIAAFAVAQATVGQAQSTPASVVKTPGPRVVTAVADPTPVPEPR